MKLGIINKGAFGQAGVDTATGLKHIAKIGFDSRVHFHGSHDAFKKEKAAHRAHLRQRKFAHHFARRRRYRLD